MKGVFIMSAYKTSSYRTAESVSPGHPDKICDQISDAILDAYLSEDPHARVAVEACGGHGKVFLTGEVTSTARVDVAPIVARLAGDVELIEHIVTQSPEMIPLETTLARSLNEYLYGKWPYDGKTQVTLYGGEIHSIVASFQNALHDELEQAVKDWARTQDYASKCFVKGRNNNPILHINPAGDWSVGGFEADAGLTGRKLVVDNYGSRIPIGGGAFSGKDATKVDRSAAYMARRIAVDYLRRFQAHEVFVYLAYAIGHDQPLEATAIVDGAEKRVEDYDLSPRGIIAALSLTSPQFEQTARYGHFGHGFKWDK